MFGKDPRQYSVMTKEFLSDDEGNVRGLITVEVEVTKDGIKVSWPHGRGGGVGTVLLLYFHVAPGGRSTAGVETCLIQLEYRVILPPSAVPRPCVLPYPHPPSTCRLSL